jgi:hypothetical protein
LPVTSRTIRHHQIVVPVDTKHRVTRSLAEGPMVAGTTIEGGKNNWR